MRSLLIALVMALAMPLHGHTAGGPEPPLGAFMRGRMEAVSTLPSAMFGQSTRAVPARAVAYGSPYPVRAVSVRYGG